eukprot:GFUD01028876.1.p1 GENE.GFUD01028876.1~~GFUD01028876.1.p1  ORF type:complete len:191 (+),score=28.43 GFUD01028876.1:102-674(+)
MKLILWLCFVIIHASISSGHTCDQDPDFSCTDSQTCCLLPQGEGVGCCPYPKATCCKDRTHCCPHGLTCDIKAARCTGSEYQLLMSQVGPSKLKTLQYEPITSNLIPRTRNNHQNPWQRPSLWSNLRTKKFCPDPDFSCDDTQTCCKLTGGDYGCCPLGPDAICCDDNEHCCPHGTECDVAGGTCTPKKI